MRARPFVILDRAVLRPAVWIVLFRSDPAVCHGIAICLCISTTYAQYVLTLHMENITHAQFQLITGVVITVGFFAFTGLVYFIDQLTSNKK